jgi:folate-binding Fe-S cluster repair protein YgfZ/Tfp pilus assembly protein PilF
MLDHFRFQSGYIQQSFVTLSLSGNDVEDFLQKQSTFDYKNLSEQKFSLMSFLDPQGRVEFYCWALKQKKQAFLLIPNLLEKVAFQRLERFLISEDVEIKNLGLENWFILIGPDSTNFKATDSYEGILIEELAYFQKILPKNQKIHEEDFEIIRKLNGWPTLNGNDHQNDLLNNLRLFELSHTPNKGCYPGQETVSKIATRRGAAYAPVLIQVSAPISSGDLFNFDRKIGQVYECIEWDKNFYLITRVLRDFRVQGMSLSLNINNEVIQGKVMYYPLLSGDNAEKAKEYFYLGAEEFRNDNLSIAEKYLRQAINLDPVNFDAYEALGVMLGRQERFFEAIEVMKKLIEVDPASVMAHTNLSLFYMRVGKIEEAEQEKSLATIKSFQKFGQEAKMKDEEQAKKEQQESEWSRRESMFRQVLEIDAEDNLANYGLGNIYVEKGLWLESISYLERVLKNDEQYSVAYLALGKAYKGLNRREDAKKIFEKGVLIAAKKGDLMPANQMQAELTNL